METLLLMQRFSVEVDLCVPAILGTVTLDGLLGAVLFDDLQDIDKAHAAIPLRCSDGLYHASAVQLVGPTQTTSHWFIAGLRAIHDLDLNLVKHGKDGQPHRRLGLSRRSEFGNVMNGYRTVMATSLRWYAEGDPQGVLDLLQGIEFVGKKRTAGFGQVHRWRLTESQFDGVMDAQGQPLRPVPLTMWGGDANAIRADVAWRPAYWLTQHRALCAVPAETMA
ncbi:MAG: hypothetical protein ACR2I0_15950 [Rhodoferax sp.]